jgi:hypothetical protein
MATERSLSCLHAYDPKSISNPSIHRCHRRRLHRQRRQVRTPPAEAELHSWVIGGGHQLGSTLFTLNLEDKPCGNCSAGHELPDQLMTLTNYVGGSQVLGSHLGSNLSILQQTVLSDCVQ